jgi:hypothetical protein
MENILYTGLYLCICIELHITVMSEGIKSSDTEIFPKFYFSLFHGTVNRAKNIMKLICRQGKPCRGEKKKFHFEETKCTVLFYLYLRLL